MTSIGRTPFGATAVTVDQRSSPQIFIPSRTSSTRTSTVRCPVEMLASRSVPSAKQSPSAKNGGTSPSGQLPSSFVLPPLHGWHELRVRGIGRPPAVLERADHRLVQHPRPRHGPLRVARFVQAPHRPRAHVDVEAPRGGPLRALDQREADPVLAVGLVAAIDRTGHARTERGKAGGSGGGVAEEAREHDPEATTGPRSGATPSPGAPPPSPRHAPSLHHVAPRQEGRAHHHLPHARRHDEHVRAERHGHVAEHEDE